MQYTVVVVLQLTLSCLAVPPVWFDGGPCGVSMYDDAGNMAVLSATPTNRRRRDVNQSEKRTDELEDESRDASHTGKRDKSDNDDDDFRVIGGVGARPYEFPWQVKLTIADSEMCGAVIISDEWILTAGHCTYPDLGLDEYDAVIGEHELGARNTARRTLHPVKVIRHEQYTQTDEGTAVNDLSLLKVSPKIQFNKMIRPVCAPDPTVSYEYSKCIVSGWGLTYDADHNVAQILQYTALNVTDNRYCNKRYKTFFQQDSSITDKLICSTSNRDDKLRDSCNGDSGGPLVVKDTQSGLFHLIGVVSWGMSKCADGYPGVYSRVTSFQDWILTTMKNN